MKVNLPKEKFLLFINNSIAEINQDVDSFNSKKLQNENSLYLTRLKFLSRLQELIGSISYDDIVEFYTAKRDKAWKNITFLDKFYFRFNKEQMPIYVTTYYFTSDGYGHSNGDYLTIEQATVSLSTFFVNFVKRVAEGKVTFNVGSIQEISEFLRKDELFQPAKEAYDEYMEIQRTIDVINKNIKNLNDEIEKLYKTIDMVEKLGLDEELIELEISNGQCSFIGGKLC